MNYYSLAPFYDKLTYDVNYDSFANFYEKLFSVQNVRVKTILDLACGTGTLTCILAARGYETIGVDASDEMLMVASEKAENQSGIIPPLFLNQPMEELDLYGTVDAIVSSLDAINYLKPELLPKVFERVKLFLEPGGIFIFDVIAPDKLRGLDGQISIDETDDIYCVWRSEFNPDLNACYYNIDIFSLCGKTWRRSEEEHVEYVHEIPELCSFLDRLGFADINVYGNLSLNAPLDSEQRIFISAKKPPLNYTISKDE